MTATAKDAAAAIGAGKISGSCGNIRIESGEITAQSGYDNSCNTHLILCDGATMSVNTTDDKAVYTIGSNLTIYGQAKGTGKLNATSTEENGR